MTQIAWVNIVYFNFESHKVLYLKFKVDTTKGETMVEVGTLLSFYGDPTRVPFTHSTIIIFTIYYVRKKKRSTEHYKNDKEREDKEKP